MKTNFPFVEKEKKSFLFPSMEIFFPAYRNGDEFIDMDEKSTKGKLSNLMGTIMNLRGIAVFQIFLYDFRICHGNLYV